MVSWPVILGLIHSKDILPQRVTSPGYHAVICLTASRAGKWDCSPWTQVCFHHSTKLFETSAKIYQFLFLWTVAWSQNMQNNLESSGKYLTWCEWVRTHAFYMARGWNGTYPPGMVDPSDTASTHETLAFWMYRRSRPGRFRPVPHLLSIFPPCLPFYCLFNLRILGSHGSPSLPSPTQHEQGSAEAVKFLSVIF